MLARAADGWQVLLVGRGGAPDPGAWTFPGASVRADEDLEATACRALVQVGGPAVGPEDLVPLGVYAERGNGPRGRCVSVLHVVALPAVVQPRARSGADESRWWSLRTNWVDVGLDLDRVGALRDIARVAPRSLLPSVRRVTERDVPLVIRLHHAALAAAGAHAGPGPWDDDLEDVAGAYLDAGGEFLVATAGPVVVGMGALRPVDAVTAEVKRMRVLPRWQGRGVGRAIGEALLLRARQLGFGRLVLDTTAQQKAAAGLYTSLGFERTGAAVVAGLPSVLFAREITPAQP
ncbi:GNAT family N-acetyltransferase [Cellulomonas bogoriensis]|uniref:GNAT family N-acetyltransferase n=1 Tax=Cellulomonas bogoriensis TaxID=301388 RepID=UPI0022B35919|nr:GNAT family N-acetyltransferase [Cellulomonas bogoriensis]